MLGSLEGLQTHTGPGWCDSRTELTEGIEGQLPAGMQAFCRRGSHSSWKNWKVSGSPQEKGQVFRSHKMIGMTQTGETEVQAWDKVPDNLTGHHCSDLGAGVGVT